MQLTSIQEENKPERNLKKTQSKLATKEKRTKQYWMTKDTL